MQLTPLSRSCAWLTATAGLTAAVATAAVRLDRMAPENRGVEEPVYLPRAEYLRPMSLGWQNALADVLWFRTISYFGEHYRSDRTYRWLASMCDLVTDLDPRAMHVYRFAGVILPWEAEQVDAGIAILHKGVRQFPDSWLLQYYLGFNYYFFKNDYERALVHLRAAAGAPGSHPQVARLAAVLAAHQSGPDTTLAFLTELQRDVSSAEVRQVIEDQIRQSQLARDLKQLDEVIAAYHTRRGAPPPSLVALVEEGLLRQLPTDPFGGHYELDATSGRARSSTGRRPSTLHQSKIRERALHGQSVRDP
ncbi:MAG: tetratricopeptide repeat protein [Candidatus Binatia bacterium]